MAICLCPYIQGYIWTYIFDQLKNNLKIFNSTPSPVVRDMHIAPITNRSNRVHDNGACWKCNRLALKRTFFLNMSRVCLRITVAKYFRSFLLLTTTYVHTSVVVRVSLLVKVSLKVQPSILNETLNFAISYLIEGKIASYSVRET